VTGFRPYTVRVDLWTTGLDRAALRGLGSAVEGNLCALHPAIDPELAVDAATGCVALSLHVLATGVVEAAWYALGALYETFAVSGGESSVVQVRIAQVDPDA
jgi:hypothetical protein